VVLPELAETQLAPPNVTDLRLDFAAFDRLFHLPAPSLKVVSTFPNPSHPWFALGEEVLDAEVVHSIAPRAALTILSVKGTSLDNADNAVAASVVAVRLGASQGGIISLSPAGQIGGEHCVDHAQVAQLSAALEDDAAHHVTVVAATGDVGAAGEPCALITALGGSGPSYTPRKEVVLVASDPLVLSVGGTTLDASHKTGAWIGETAWKLPRRRPGLLLPGVRRGVQSSLRPTLIPERCPRHRRDARRPRRRRRRQPRYRVSRCHEQRGRRLHDERARRHERRFAHLGRDHRPRRPVRKAPPRLCEPGDLPNRSQFSIPPGLPRRQGGNNTAEFPLVTIIGYHAGPGWDPVTGWGSPIADVLVTLLSQHP
jgi:hypothetical protein